MLRRVVVNPAFYLCTAGIVMSRVVGRPHLYWDERVKCFGVGRLATATATYKHLGNPRVPRLRSRSPTTPYPDRW